MANIDYHNCNGQSHERLYHVYSNIYSRCYNPNSSSHKYYGAKNIAMCDEWKEDYNVFKEWAISTGYDENAERGKCTIDRIDVNGNYEPSNCRWVGMDIQANNKNEYKKRGWSIDGITKPIQEWCDEYGQNVPMVMYRVRKKGMSLKEALTIPVTRGKNCEANNITKQMILDLRNRGYTVKRMCEELNCGKTLIERRLREA